jgi:hypothetical protein
MGLTIREGRGIARTEATIDWVYPGGAAREGKAEAGVYDGLGQQPAREDMLIIMITY